MKSIACTIGFVLVILSCASLTGKWSESAFDSLSEKCKEENLAAKPSTKNWHNLSTQERTKKKRQLDDYRKKRIELYQAIEQYKAIYFSHVDSGGRCRNTECAKLPVLKQRIIVGCPVAGPSFPEVRNELK